MAASPRIGVSITEELDNALTELAVKQRRPKSEMIRIVLEELVAQNGYKVTTRLQHGGRRERKGQKS